VRITVRIIRIASLPGSQDVADELTLRSLRLIQIPRRGAGRVT
jgi:hypothetical protein